MSDKTSMFVKVMKDKQDWGVIKSQRQLRRLPTSMQILDQKRDSSEKLVNKK